MITIDHNLNELEALVVAEELRKSGIESYSMSQGNGCIQVSHGRVCAYYIFREGRLVDIQFD